MQNKFRITRQQNRLQDFVGTIQTDAYEVYQALQRKESCVVRIGCLAHARRRFYAALEQNLAEAVWFFAQIRLLYEIEDEAQNLDAAQRHALRHRKAPAIWEMLKAKALQLQPQFLPRGTKGIPLCSLLDEYHALTGCLRDGYYEIDNSLVENFIRPSAIGKKRRLFIGHPDAGRRSAVACLIVLIYCRLKISAKDYIIFFLFICRCTPAPS